MIAAKRSGITNVLIPKENLGDVEEIEANILKNLNITPVENINEVLKEALIWTIQSLQSQEFTN